jgi:NAD(P)-dependent dehydrogenase (short-subunit alcohol dehydrogenase family)
MPAKRVLITGGGSGLGLAMAQFCAERGDRVFIADIQAERAQTALAALPGKGHIAFAMDVTSTSDWQQAHNMVQQEFGGLDILINNAGVASSGQFIEVSDAEWDRVVAINQTAVHKGCRSMLPLLLPTRGGLIINVASFAGLAGAPDLGAYGVTKAAVVAYSEILRAQLWDKFIHVAVLCPSFFQTNLLQSFAPGHERMQDVAAKLMQKSKHSAADVAAFTITQAQAGRFLLLPHEDTHMRWRIKRWFPEYYFRSLLKFFKRTRA